MKILINTQDKAVGGIVRMVNTFVGSVLKTDPSISFHFAIVFKNKTIGSQKREYSTRTQYGFPADCLALPDDYYTRAIEEASSLEELKTKLSHLITFYLETIERSNPDVVLINGTYYRPWALLQAARQKNIPYVVYVHGSVVQEAKGVSGPIFSLLKEMEKDFYAEKAHYIFPSRVALKGTLFYDHERSDTFHVIHNPLDEVFFTSKKPKNTSTNTANTIGFVLRWEEVKNTDFILEFIKYNKTAPNPYTIKVVSDLSAEKAMLFEDQFTEFLPPKTMNEMVAFYKEVDLILNPSFFETFGYVPAEAVACGTPAIISPQQGVSEVFLQNGLERMIFDFSDVSEVHKKIPGIIQAGILDTEVEKFRADLDPLLLSKKVLSIASKAINSNIK